jgi:hypothetical protein
LHRLDAVGIAEQVAAAYRRCGRLAQNHCIARPEGSSLPIGDTAQFEVSGGAVLRM